MAPGPVRTEEGVSGLKMPSRPRMLKTPVLRPIGVKLHSTGNPVKTLKLRGGHIHGPGMKRVRRCSATGEHEGSGQHLQCGGKTVSYPECCAQPGCQSSVRVGGNLSRLQSLRKTYFPTSFLWTLVEGVLHDKGRELRRRSSKQVGSSTGEK